MRPGAKPPQPLDRYPRAMCIRCHIRDTDVGDDHCHLCAFATRMEAARGLQRLDEYLGAWAAFQDWLDRHRPGAVARAA
jgi:hypothetical protein